jgi:hypothetical protein
MSALATIDLGTIAEAKRDLAFLIDVALEFQEKLQQVRAILSEGGDLPAAYMDRLLKTKAEQQRSLASISRFLKTEPVDLLLDGKLKSFCERTRTDMKRWTAVFDELATCRDRGFRMLS